MVHSNLVSEKELLNPKTDVIDNGTSGGGCIEVYANEEYAIKRNNYLTGFDGSFLGAGSHELVGTCIIRISDNLTASKQKTLTDHIIDALTKLD